MSLVRFYRSSSCHKICLYSISGYTKNKACYLHISIAQIGISTNMFKLRKVTLCLQNFIHRRNFVEWWLSENCKRIRKKNQSAKMSRDVVLGLRSSSGRKRVAVAPSITGTKLKVCCRNNRRFIQGLSKETWSLWNPINLGLDK